MILSYNDFDFCKQWADASLALSNAQALRAEAALRESEAPAAALSESEAPADAKANAEANINDAIKEATNAATEVIRELEEKSKAKSLSDKAAAEAQAIAAYNANKGSMSGIGIWCERQEDNRFKITSYIQDSPVSKFFIKGDIKIGDYLVSVDNEPTTGKQVSDVRKLIIGPIGKSVTIGVQTWKNPNKIIKCEIIRSVFDSNKPKVSEVVTARMGGNSRYSKKKTKNNTKLKNKTKRTPAVWFA